jgi:hypothetical protein
MTIEFVAVARGSVILAAFASPGTDLEREVQSLLEQPFVHNEQRRTSYHIFTFHKNQTLSFICSTPPEVDPKIPLRFIQLLATRFNSAYPTISPTAPAHSLTRQAQGLITNTITEVIGLASKTDQLKQELGETQRVLNQSLQKALGRGDELQLLTESSERIVSTSEDFRTQSRNLKNKMRCEYWKSWGWRIVVLLVIVYFILKWFCGGWTLQKCRPR